MVSFNQVIFAGNVGRESELRKTEEGTSVARFSLAVDTFSGKDEDKAPMWLTVVCWRQLAEQVSKIVKKGSLVLVSGRLSVRSYTDKEQKERTAVEVIASTVQVLPMPSAKESASHEELPEAA